MCLTSAFVLCNFADIKKKMIKNVFVVAMVVEFCSSTNDTKRCKNDAPFFDEKTVLWNNKIIRQFLQTNKSTLGLVNF